MANDREAAPVGGENSSKGSEGRPRKPWTAPRLETIAADDIRTSGNLSIQDGTGCYMPA